MRKQIKTADIITFSRILLSVVLLFPAPLSALFRIVYLLCGLSDMADGWIARKTHTESKTGARLDSIADLLFLAVSAIKLLPVLHVGIWIWIWAAGIAVLKLLAMLRRRTPLPPHSIANKLTGVLLFLLPLTISFVNIRCSAAVVCAVATFAAVQDCLCKTE